MVRLFDCFQGMWDLASRHRNRNTALLSGGGILFVGLVGFEGNLGPEYSSRLPEAVGFLLQAMLLWLSLVCFVVAWYYHQ